MTNVLFFSALAIFSAGACLYHFLDWKTIWVIFDIAPQGVHTAVCLRFRKRYKIHDQISDWVAKQTRDIDWSIRLAALPVHVQEKTQIRVSRKGKFYWIPLGQFVKAAFEELAIKFPDGAQLDPNGKEWIEHLITIAVKGESNVASVWLIELSRSPNLAKAIADLIVRRLKDLASSGAPDVEQTIALCRLFGNGAAEEWFDKEFSFKRSLFDASMKMTIFENLLLLASMAEPDINWAVAEAIDKNLTINDYDVLEFLLSRAADKSANRLIRVLAFDVLRHCYRLDLSRRKVWPSMEWVDSQSYRISLISTDREVTVQHAALRLGAFYASLRYSATGWRRAAQST